MYLVISVKKSIEDESFINHVRYTIALLCSTKENCFFYIHVFKERQAQINKESSKIENTFKKRKTKIYKSVCHFTRI